MVAYFRWDFKNHLVQGPELRKNIKEILAELTMQSCTSRMGYPDVVYVSSELGLLSLEAVMRSSEKRVSSLVAAQVGSNVFLPTENVFDKTEAKNFLTDVS